MNGLLNDLRLANEITRNDLLVSRRGMEQMSWKRLAVMLALGCLILPWVWAGLAAAGTSAAGMSDGGRGALELVYLMVFVFTAFYSSAFFMSPVIKTRDTILLMSSPVSRDAIILGRFMSVLVKFSFLILPPFLAYIIPFALGTGNPFHLVGGLLGLLGIYAIALVLGLLLSLVLVRTFTAKGGWLLRAMVVGGGAAIFIVVRYLVLTAIEDPTSGAPSIFGYASAFPFLQWEGVFLPLTAVGFISGGLLLSQRIAFSIWMHEYDRGDDTVTSGASPGLPSKPSRGDAWITKAVGEPAGGVAHKEFLFATRDPEVLVRLWMSAVLIVLPLFFDSGAEKAYWFVPFILAMAGWFAIIMLAGNSLGSEGGRLWMLRATPIKGREFFMGKWAVSAILTTAFILAIYVVAVVAVPMEIGFAELTFFFALTVGIAGTAIGVGVSSMFPYFTTIQNNRPSIPAIMLTSVLLMVAFFPAMSVLTIPDWLLVTVGEPDLLRLIGVLITVIVSALLTGLFIRLGARAYEKVQPKRV